MFDDEELKRRVREGKRDAEEELAALYRPRLLRVATFFLGNEDGIARQVVQDTLSLALSELKRDTPGEPVYLCLRRICLRVSYAHLRDLSRRLSIVEASLESLLTKSAGPAGFPARAPGRRKVLTSLIASLPPEHAAVAELRLGQGLSYSLIRQALDLPLGTVLVRLTAGLIAITKSLARLNVQGTLEGSTGATDPMPPRIGQPDAK